MRDDEEADVVNQDVPGDVDGDGLPDVPAVGGDAFDDDPAMAFWRAALAHVGDGRFDVVMGEPAAEVVLPPAWSFGETPEQADELLGLVLAGRKTATASASAELEGEGADPPRVGELSLVTDGRGEPRVVLRTTRVDVVPFDEVDAVHAVREGGADFTVEAWREVHGRVWRRSLGAAFDPHMPVVLEQFEVVYPTDGPAPQVG